MSLIREKYLYEAYCNLCLYTNKIPLSKSKWKKQLDNGNLNKSKHNIKDIQKELEKILEYA